MPAKTDRRHRQGQESRQRIIDAALAIAAERGYDGTTVALITERAEVPASSVYWQFKNKDELLAEALDYSYRTWRREGPTWQPANYSGSPRERIMTRLRLSTGSIETEPEYWRLGLMVSMLRKTRRIAAQERFMLVRQETILILDEWWRSVLPQIGEDAPALTDLLSRSYLSLVDGLFVAHRATPSLDLQRLCALVGEGMADAAQKWASDVPGSLQHVHEPVEPAVEAALEGASDDSRERLLRAAEEIASERGYKGTTISRICKQTGLPASSVYWFFADKDELLAEVVQHSWDEWSAAQPAWNPPEPGQTWDAALRAILRRSVRSLLDAPSFMRIGHMLTLEQHSEEVAARTRFLVIRGGIGEGIAGWFAEFLPPAAIDAEPALPHVLAQTLIAATDGFFIGHQIDDAEPSVPGFVEFLVDILASTVARATESEVH